VIYGIQQICAKRISVSPSGDRPTVCVTGAGEGVDSVWKQEKLEARKILEKPHRTPASSARFVGTPLTAKYFAIKNPQIL
jgi:hypothetical protein